MVLKRSYKQTELGVIPEDWDCSTVKGIASPIRNAIVGGPFGSDLVSADYVDDGVPVIRGQNMGSKFVSEPFVFVSQSKANSLEANLAHPGDLIFTQRGTLGQVSIVPDQPFDCYLVSQSQMKVTVNEKLVNPVFLFYVFISPFHQNLIRLKTTQTSLPHINLGILRSIPIQLPPLFEQTAIATALSEVDALLTSLDTLIAKKRAIKQGAMQELLTGRTRLPGFSEEWKLYTFGEIFTFLKTANNPRSELIDSGEVGYVHYGDIHTRWKSFLDCSGTELPFIPAEKVKNIPCLEDGDLIMADASEDYAGIGVSVEVKNVNGRKIVAGLHTLLLRGNKDIVADGFKGYLLNLSLVKDAFLKIATGISVYGISKNNIKNISLLLPIPEEQRAIASVLSDMEADIHALEQQRDKTRQIKQGMMQELLTGRTRLI